jgi:hypothetical protein
MENLLILIGAILMNVKEGIVVECIEEDRMRRCLEDYSWLRDMMGKDFGLVRRSKCKDHNLF